MTRRRSSRRTVANAMVRPHGRCLVGAAEGAECAGDDACRGFRPRVIGAEDLLKRRERRFGKSERFERRALVEPDGCEIGPSDVRLGMLLAQDFPSYGQGPFDEGPGARQVALILQQTTQVVEARCGPGMLGAERLFEDRRGALMEWPRPGKVAEVLKQAREVAEARRGIGMLGTERLLADRQRPLVERPRADQIALVLKQAGEVVEARRDFGMLGAERLLANRERALEKRARLYYAASAPCLYEASRSRR